MPNVGLGSVRMRRGLEGGVTPLSFPAGRPPTVPPPPGFLAWFHPATLHLDLDERFCDLWRHTDLLSMLQMESQA